MKILYVVHSNPWVEYSGTPLIAGQYACQAVTQGHDVALLTPHLQRNLRPMPPEYPFSSAIKVFHWTSIENWSEHAFQMSPAEFAVQEICVWPFLEFQPDLVHVIDWVGISPSFLHSLKNLDIPIIRHVWNFEDFCQFIEPIHKGSIGLPCPPPFDAQSCATCIAQKVSVPLSAGNVTLGELKKQILIAEKNIVESWLETSSKRIHEVQIQATNYYDHFIFASQNFYDYWQRFLGIDIPYSVVPHGCEIDGTPHVTEKITNNLNCIYIGGANYRKGWDVVERAFGKILSSGVTNIRLRIYGDFETTRKSALAAFSQIEFFDAYRPQDLTQIFGWADVGIVPTRFETYCRAVREMMLCGVAPVASPAFGVPDILENGYNGLLIDPEDDASLINALLKLSGDPIFLQTLKNNASKTPITTPAEEFASLMALYDSMVT